MRARQFANSLGLVALYLKPLTPCLIKDDDPAPSAHTTGVPTLKYSKSVKLNISQVEGTTANFALACSALIS
ncbi:hypothetical protein D9M72_631980 [compost metagenome]